MTTKLTKHIVQIFKDQHTNHSKTFEPLLAKNFSQ